MASLNLSCPTIPTSSQPRSSASRPVFPKQSHFITHAKRLNVSCQNKPDTSAADAAGKIDRRNMLLGLGGLYGASSLASAPGASAEPVSAPELDKCHLGKNWNTNSDLSEKCCLNTSETIIDYKLPANFKIKMRPSAHRASPEYIYKYNLALDRMRRLPKDDPRSFHQQAMIHCAYCNASYYQPGTDNVDLQVHHNWLFFPFHRWYLYFYERILGSLIGDPTFAIPFWNWDNPKGMTVPPMFLDPKSSLYNTKRDPDMANATRVVDLGLTFSEDPLQVVTNNLTVMHNEMIRANSNACDFMGRPYRKGEVFTNSGEGSSERGSHTSLHYWIGTKTVDGSNEDMGNFYSAGRDPIFYCHHANVDRMWTLWQYFLPSEKVPDKRITDPDFLNASFVFWDENKRLVRVTVKDSLDNLGMGYEYERIDLPWLDYRPPPQTAGARVKRASKTAQTAAATFPLSLDKVVRVEIPKTKKGKADELLVIENITVDTRKFLKFDVFVNDEDDNVTELDKASYAGTFAQVPSRTDNRTATTTIRLKLTDLYEDMDVEDDDTVVVTLVPRHQGPGVTIGGIKIIENPKPDPARDSFNC